MRIILLPIVVLTFLNTGVSCKKDRNRTVNCRPGVNTVRVITKQQVKVSISGERVYLTEKGTIDSRLSPCNLAEEFRVNGLDVIVSGEVISTPYNSGEPCCTSEFFVTEISK